MGGGQVPDSGTLTLANGSQWSVTDVFQPYEGGIALKVIPTDGIKNIDRKLEEDKEFLEVKIYFF